MPRPDRKDCLRFLVGVCAQAGPAGTGSSADLGSGPPALPPERYETRQWTLSFTPYGWLTGLNGDTTVKGRTTDIDADAFEVLEHLDGAPWMSYAEARAGRLALYNDIVYAPIGVDASSARSFRGLSVDATLGVDIEQAIIEAGAAYEIARWGHTAVDVLAGARYWHQDVAINLALTTTLDVAGLVVSRDRAVARAGGVDWVDPLVGLRVRYQLAPGQDLLLRGDVGGFDAGSQFSWNVLATYSFEIAVHSGVTYSGVLGYRALGADYEKGSGANRYVYDVVQHGPLLGLTVSF